MRPTSAEGQRRTLRTSAVEIGQRLTSSTGLEFAAGWKAAIGWQEGQDRSSESARLTGADLGIGSLGDASDG